MINFVSKKIGFLYIDPLKQGLKHVADDQNVYFPLGFLYIDPLKQGLKQH